MNSRNKLGVIVLTVSPHPWENQGANSVTQAGSEGVAMTELFGLLANSRCCPRTGEKNLFNTLC